MTLDELKAKLDTFSPVKVGVCLESRRVLVEPSSVHRLRARFTLSGNVYNDSRFARTSSVAELADTPADAAAQQLRNTPASPTNSARRCTPA